MRNDALGFFWEDPITEKKTKRTPPEPVWERDDYLPGLEEARAFDVPYMTDEDLLAAFSARETLLWDIECYVNYFQIAFMSAETGKIIDFIQINNAPLDRQKVSWVLQNFEIVGFNSKRYDEPMAACALSGMSCSELKQVSDKLIVENIRPYLALRSAKVKPLKGLNHIDLCEVAPGVRTSLKKYAGRMHATRMQELPVAPSATLSVEQMAITRLYCVNDLHNTRQLRALLKDELALRVRMSLELGEDLRSKSDAQVAEAVIGKEIQKLTGVRPKTPNIDSHTTYKYKPPTYMRFYSDTMQKAFDFVKSLTFELDLGGSIALPPELADFKIKIGNGCYTLRIGGLHSTEHKVKHIASDDVLLKDWDVESYYPRVMLNLGLYPPHIGPAFLSIFESIVNRRIEAKKKGDKSTADSLKITINGSYGKLGNYYSIFYAPDLVMQVCMTGQLTLLMLIERLEIAGINVVSANTDGIVVRVLRHQYDLAKSIVSAWEQDTQFKTEETSYSAVYSRDVNNYIALKTDGSAPKLKGVFGNPWSYAKSKSEWLKKNPVNSICVKAVVEFIANKIPINETIRKSRDITEFVAVREAKGGGVAGGIFLGKSVRWYYSTDKNLPEIVSAFSGNKVATSDGGKACMTLPTAFPDDVDFDRYIAEAEKILESIGY